ncbi:MAG: hypothetical protein WD875_11120 [Pirellulales bacterium]
MSHLMVTCRLIVDEPAEGAWNMAVDDVLLSAAAERGEAALRFYGWAEPTLSLGYFQAIESRQRHAPSGACPVVRRASGGGAILHDRELTYSLALPNAYCPQRNHGELYAVVHDLLCEALATLGVVGARRYATELWEANPFAEESPSALGRRKDSPPTATTGTAESEPFLCFERRTEHDVVLSAPDSPQCFAKIAGSKIAGSAQRKRRGAVLQHGSVLLARSQFAPSLPGIEDVAGVQMSAPQLVAAWIPLLSEGLGLRLVADRHSPGDLADAQRATTDKFAAESWLRRR